ncbi:hypothetical protein ACFV0B_24145 [Streptomyces xanthophaeus]|uniref:hypothetical protein n=1 Tax=Streptomyces xanthophaeus TaxID=67385 RepID=UPI00368B4D74
MTEEPTGSPGLTVISADDVKPEDIGVLSVRYVDGAAQLVVTGGTALPAHLPVVDAQGAVVAAYLQAHIAPKSSRARLRPGDENALLDAVATVGSVSIAYNANSHEHNYYR